MITDIKKTIVASTSKIIDDTLQTILIALDYDDHLTVVDTVNISMNVFSTCIIKTILSISKENNTRHKLMDNFTEKTKDALREIIETEKNERTNLND